MTYPPQQFPPQPQRQFQQPQQQGFYPPQQQATAQWPQQAAPVGGPPVLASLPQFFMPDEAAEAESYRKSREESASWGQVDGPVFLKIPGPRGEEKFSQVQVGGSGSVNVWILPPAFPEQRSLAVEVRSHFWKSQKNPRGRGINCGGGPDTCLICKVRELGLAHPNEEVKKRIKDFTKQRRKYYYNVAVISDPAKHAYANGTYRSVVMDAGVMLHQAIGEIVGMVQGVAKLTHPSAGRMLRVKKTKTGPLEMDVEYNVLPYDEAPLPQAFWFLLEAKAQWNLLEFTKTPTQEDQMRAVEDMGFLFLLQGQQGAAYSPTPQAPYGNPYAATPPMMPPQGYGQSPQAQFQPPMAQPPAAWMPPAPPAPPAFNPPPVTSGPPVAAYQPQVGQMPVQNPTPAGPQVQATPVELRKPLPPGLMLPEARERCFGGYNASDRMCQSCPEWIRNQCAPQSAQAPQAAVPMPGPSAELAALQAALQGVK